MNLKELKDKIDEIWNKADVETKVDKSIYIVIEEDDIDMYYPLDEIYIDSNKDIIIKGL